MAMVEVNKIDHVHDDRQLLYIREGVEAARELADRLAKAAEPFLQTAPAARRQEFSQAMRQRIRDVAAARYLPDAEIKTALSLKHQAIGEYIQRHGINASWLLEGIGRVFVKNDPVSAISKLPAAEREMIRAMVQEILAERLGA